MTRRPCFLQLWTLVLALGLLAAGCGNGDSDGGSQASDRPATEADGDGRVADALDQHGQHGQHDDHDDHQSNAADDAAASPSGAITADTIARMRAIDPARAAASHQHHGDHAERDHPNGVSPERIVIPAIGVDADVIDLGVDANGEMEVPTDFDQTGWFKPGVPPGRVGPAVIAGHVDSRTGPAVFHRLTELAPGDRIEVHGDTGDIVTFEVRETEQHPKDAFPTKKVYAGTAGPELRLITCGGDFDRGERSYRDNFIVYAERVDVDQRHGD